MDDRWRDLVGPDDDRVLAALRTLAEGLSLPPDEVTAARHRRAIRVELGHHTVRSLTGRARPSPLGRGVAAAVLAAVLAAGMLTAAPLEVAPASTDRHPPVEPSVWELPQGSNLLRPSVPSATDEVGSSDEAARFGHETAEEASRFGRETAEEASRFGRETAEDTSDGRSTGQPGDRGTDAREMAPPPPPEAEAGRSRRPDPPVTGSDAGSTVRETDTPDEERADAAQGAPAPTPPDRPGR